MTTELSEPIRRRVILRTLGGPLRWVLLGLIHLYQLIPHAGPPRCRFYPSCSSYALTALRKHGAAKGTALAARRLLRCHPFSPGGIDYVPSSRHTGG